MLLSFDCNLTLILGLNAVSANVAASEEAEAEAVIARAPLHHLPPLVVAMMIRAVLEAIAMVLCMLDFAE